MRHGLHAENEEISEGEVRKVIRKLNLGKSSRCVWYRCMVNFLRQVEIKSTVRWLTEVTRMVWREGKASLDWRRVIIVPLYKKGSRLECQNCSGGISIPGKVHARVMNERVKRQISGRVMVLQGGFREGRNCFDQILTLRQIMEKVIEKNN